MCSRLHIILIFSFQVGHGHLGDHGDHGGHGGHVEIKFKLGYFISINWVRGRRIYVLCLNTILIL